MRDPEADNRSRETVWNGVHLVVLSAFALAQPLFDIFGRNPEFFAVRGSTATEIVVFALVVAFALPVALIGIELAVALVSRAAAHALHLFFVGCLVAVVILHILTKTELISGEAALVVAALLGAGGALLYCTNLIRTFLTFLAPAPLVFLLLFLLSSPVSKLVLPEKAEAMTVAVEARTPVVVLVFDELTTAALMDSDGRVDAQRWPNFAALARNSTWFRSATTIDPHTEHAVPAILDGKLPNPSLLPIFADHPENLFTFLGGSYRLKVVEALTHMCPPSLCHKTTTEGFDPNANDETGSIVSDAAIVYLHLVLPNPYASDLPPISNTWGNFGGHEQTDEETARSAGEPTATVPACARNICQFTSLIAADRKPTLYYVHAILPHVPWRYLPSGKHYAGNTRVIPGVENGYWTTDRWLTIQAQQRYLLQLGYTDQALGIILQRLRATGIYDRALMIVTSDHGETFLPGEPRRNVTKANFADIGFIPLFVKLPGQKRGRIDDSFATNMDVLPTIAHVLRARLPWHVDGRPLVGGRLPADATVSVLSSSGRSIQERLSKLRAQRARELTHQQSVFGTGPLGRVYRIGSHQELLGKSIAKLDIHPSRSASVELGARELLGVVDLSSNLLPNYLTGNITGSRAQQQPLAVAVDGTIRAVTRSYTEFGKTKFAALVPEGALHAGANDVAVFTVHEAGARLVLEELRRSDLTFALGKEVPPVIESSDGKTIRVAPGALVGEVRASARVGGTAFGGWAADVRARQAAELVVIFADGRSVYVGRPGNLARNDVQKLYGAEKAGFILELPDSLLPAPGLAHQVRVFAIKGGVASELRYLPRYPWATGS